MNNVVKSSVYKSPVKQVSSSVTNSPCKSSTMSADKHSVISNSRLTKVTTKVSSESDLLQLHTESSKCTNVSLNSSNITKTHSSCHPVNTVNRQQSMDQLLLRLKDEMVSWSFFLLSLSLSCIFSFSVICSYPLEAVFSSSLWERRSPRVQVAVEIQEPLIWVDENVFYFHQVERYKWPFTSHGDSRGGHGSVIISLFDGHLWHSPLPEHWEEAMFASAHWESALKGKSEGTFQWEKGKLVFYVWIWLC